MAHKTLVGGTAYEISGGKCLVGGTAYSIQKGRTLVGGTGYDVSFGPKTIPVTITTSGTTPTKVYAKIDGTEYRTATSGIRVFPGDVITFSIYSGASNLLGQLYVDGTRVATAQGKQVTYDWTVPDCSAITVNIKNMTSSGKTYCRIDVTTA